MRIGLLDDRSDLIQSGLMPLLHTINTRVGSQVNSRANQGGGSAVVTAAPHVDIIFCRTRELQGLFCLLSWLTRLVEAQALAP
jgi:hypothetical protein